MNCDPVDVRRLPLLPLLEQSFEGVALIRPAPWRLAYVNSTLARWLGRAPAQLIDRAVDDFFRGRDGLSLAHRLKQVLSGHEDEVVADIVNDQQASIPVVIRIVRLDLCEDTILGVVVRKAAAGTADGDLAPAERRDPLTTLPDRAFLLARLKTLLDRSRLDNRRVAVLFVDLDNFKQVNDAHGHLVGDAVLSEVARRLNSCVRDEDCVARYGGDEFVVLIEGVDTVEEIQPVISRLHAVLRDPISLSNGKAELTASIGLAVSSANLSTPEDLLTAADRAMYASKQRG